MVTTKVKVYTATELEQAIRERHAKSGKKGGTVTRNRHGSEHFSRIARMRHKKLKMANAKKNGTTQKGGRSAVTVPAKTGAK